MKQFSTRNRCDERFPGKGYWGSHVLTELRYPGVILPSPCPPSPTPITTATGNTVDKNLAKSQ